MINLQSVSKLQSQSSLKVQRHSCPQGKPAFRVCTNKDCTYPAICCRDFDCECNKTHLDCPQINLESLLKKLYSKVNNSQEILNKANTFFDNVIDRVSQIAEQTQKIIKRYGLQEPEIQFLQYLQENLQHKLTGKIVYDANKNASIKFQGDFGQIQKCVDKLWNQMDGVLWGIFYSTKDLYEIPLKKNKLNPHSGQNFLEDVLKQMKTKIHALQGDSPKITNILKSDKLTNEQYLRQRIQRKIQLGANQIPMLNRGANLNIQQRTPDIKQIKIDKQQINKEQQKKKQPIKESQIARQRPRPPTIKSNESSFNINNNQQRQNNRSSSMFNIFSRPNNTLSFFGERLNSQACQTLSQVCNISKIEAQNFVRQNRVNYLGIQRNAQQILELWWAKQSGLDIDQTKYL